ncbi:hypothetical protein [Nocardia acidivorans]|uniref:hypothetical protein n=1 Tax=Nocardia acidivorans TaxID=404580 RepID=UPI0008337D69|nr:hypothetical protein [Nocardia acidivorans]
MSSPERAGRRERFSRWLMRTLTAMAPMVLAYYGTVPAEVLIFSAGARRVRLDDELEVDLDGVWPRSR